MTTWLARVARAGVGAPRRVLLGVVVLTAVLLALATQIDSSASVSLLTDQGSGVGQATAQQERAFGSDPVLVVLSGDVRGVLEPAALKRLIGLERRLRRVPGVRTVFGPGTFVDQAVQQAMVVIRKQLAPVAGPADRRARDAEKRARARGLSAAQVQAYGEAERVNALGPELRGQFQEIFTRYGLSGLPSVDNTAFTSALVFGAHQNPKGRFGWLFPDRRHALVIVRLDAGLPDSRVAHAGSEITRLVAGTHLAGIRARTVGAPLVSARLPAETRSQLLRLVPLGLALLALTLLAVLRTSPRALVLLVPAVLAVLLTVLLSWALGLGSTPATVAALPVVLGLAVDYVIQLRARHELIRRTQPRGAEAAVAALAAVGPVLLLAAVAMSAGFLVLTLSPVPLIDRLGQTLALGTLCAVGCALLLAAPILLLADHGTLRAPSVPIPAVLLRLASRGLVLAVIGGVAVAGLATASHVSVEADLRKLAPAGMGELRDVLAVQRELGTSGDLRISVTARDVTAPAVLRWMRSASTRIVALRRDVRPGPNLADLLAGSDGGQIPGRARVNELLDLVPPAYLTAVRTPDATRAELSFAVPLLALDEQRRFISRVQRVLDDAPVGVSAQPAGLVASAAASSGQLEGGRPWLLLLAALLAAAILIVSGRHWTRAAVVVTPGLVAAGICLVVVNLLHVRLAPLSAVLEPLILAVGVEFSLLLEGRYDECRAAGRSASEAMQEAASSVGGAVLASALTVAAGFGVLAFSSMGLLIQFGIVAALELAVTALVAVLLTPVLAARAEQGRVALAGPRARRRLQPRIEPGR